MSAANTDRLLLVNRVARDERRVSDRGMRSRGRAAVLAVLAVLVLLVLGATTAFAATTTAYVANSGAGTVSVIDTATNMVIATILHRHTVGISRPSGALTARRGSRPSAVARRCTACAVASVSQGAACARGSHLANSGVSAGYRRPR